MSSQFHTLADLPTWQRVLAPTMCVGASQSWSAYSDDKNSVPTGNRTSLVQSVIYWLCAILTHDVW